MTSDTLAASATLPPQADANLSGSLGGTAGSSPSAVDRGGPVPKRRKGNKSKKLPASSGKMPSAILDWTESMVRDLMTLRFDTYADRIPVEHQATHESGTSSYGMSSKSNNLGLAWHRQKHGVCKMQNAASHPLPN
ncbi:hypothetical protein GN958_ATG23471 [Phytophthora infestans]|uniref:Uncharacterized protein n=1 Tax=Phytophthora infestans TaxID=4787 RepID=A0A8S9THJ1_PHYIN|nr:hypothetical protein GN958_ATG23471 [Phytophthora infestans]